MLNQKPNVFLGPSPLALFLSSFEKVSEEIVNEVPDWHEYAFGENNILSGNNERSALGQIDVRNNWKKLLTRLLSNDILQVKQLQVKHLQIKG